MKAVIDNGKITIHNDEELVIKDRIPCGCYDVCFSKDIGSFLRKKNVSKVKEKIYGNQIKKAEKVFKAYDLIERNLGIILSGDKGSGKTLFVNVLIERAIALDMPIIFVSENQPNLVKFLSSIEQEYMVIFDEFEKNFKDMNGASEDVECMSEQNQFLSYFDGFNNSKKIFVITCNIFQSLSRYIVERPGRFHYHFKLNNPNSQEIKDYCNDNLKKEYHKEIDRIVKFSLVSNLTYDWLRAICFEINQGYTLEETIDDLNISNGSYLYYEFSITINNEEYTSKQGLCITNKDIDILLHSDNNKRIKVKFESNNLILLNSGNAIVKSQNITIKDFYDDDLNKATISDLSINQASLSNKNILF